MRRAALAIPLVLAAALVGCAGQQGASNADDLSGEQKAVAQVVDDLSEAGLAGEAKDICNTIFAPEVADALKQGNSDCQEAVDNQLEDASNFDLDIEKITIDGTTATVVVTSEFDGEELPRTLTLEKSNNAWRIAGISGGEPG